MKLLAALVLIGCFIVSSVSTKLEQNNEQEVSISEISIVRARILVQDIRNANKDLQNNQFAVLCLVPRTEKYLTFQNLGVLHLCTPATRPDNSKKPAVHSETLVLRQWGNLLNAFKNSIHHNRNYDMFLHTYYSPCNNCANEIVTAVRQNAARLFFNFYVTFWTPYRETLDATENIFKQYNGSHDRPHRITMYEQFGPPVTPTPTTGPRITPTPTTRRP